MTTVWPLRFRRAGDELLFSDEAGGWFVSDETFLERYVRGNLSATDLQFLKFNGHAYERQGDLGHSGFLRRWADRHSTAEKEVGYVILVPTLRCNLACTYCQVSRAAETAAGYDWTEETEKQVIAFLDGLGGAELKVEFQGGEPLLRLDILERVRAFCRNRFERATFVVCSNFQNVDQRTWAFFEADDTFLSTSIDGDFGTHTSQRTHSAPLSATFFSNLRSFIDRFGNGRVSALPTVDLSHPVDADALIASFADYGLRSIYLRPINHQGFARRTPFHGPSDTWRRYHRRFVEALIKHNFEREEHFEEFYLTHAIRRILQPGANGFVDLRNPNALGRGYLVVDYDGTLYPTDEARMMARVGQIDLSIGTVAAGVDEQKVRQLNSWTSNDFDPDCQHCAFQPYCGTDIVDDISRYGRIDVPKADTWFCQRHLALFDLAFELLRSTDEKVRYSVARWAGVPSLPAHFAEIHR